jgi:hypothetical protein
MKQQRKDAPESREALVDDLAALATGGAAEMAAQETDTQFFRDHLPITEHQRVLDRDVMLVLGGRGTGKTQLFDALRRLRDPAALAAGGGRSASPSSPDVCVAGFTQTRTRDCPDSVVLQRCLARDQDKVAQNLWTGLLAGILIREDLTGESLKQCLPADTCDALANRLAAPSEWLSLVDRDIEKVGLGLNRADEALQKAGRYLVVTYDDLDILAARMTHVYPLIRELLAFWLRNSRRWGHLRCKVFLRTDIFNSDELAFTDSSKLRPRSVTLRWSPDNLYRLVLKRLLNKPTAKAWRAFLGGRVPQDRLKKLDPWGTVPSTEETHHRAFVKRLVGEYMGTDPRRGETYSWFLNHLQDSLGEIAPRSFLKLFELSAARQRSASLPRSDHLLEPQQIVGALAEVSQDRIAELTQEEYPWIKSVARSLRDQTVPMERRDFRRLLKGINWDKSSQPPHTDPDRLIDDLLRLGVLRETTDQRIHVPDIYLYGFALKRKGGIRRPKA